MVNTTVAIPLPFVTLVGLAKDPPLVLLQVTTLPEVLTGLPPASASCALIVTAAPAPALEVLEVTRYWVAAGTLLLVSSMV